MAPVAAPVREPGSRTGARRLGDALRRPAVAAVVTWLVAVPPAAAVPAVFDLDPFLRADAAVPLVLGGFAVAVGGWLALRKPVPAVSGVAAGLFAAWTVLLLRTSLHGTPFAPGGLTGDTGRLSAMVTRYTVTSASSDAIVAGVPSEYPPLFPWLAGKAAVLFGVEAWRVLAPALILTVSASIVAGFVLWSLLTSPGAALLISAMCLMNFGTPEKAYEVLALAVVVPLLLLTVAAPPRRRPHWLPAGLLAGLLVLTYVGYLIYAVLGILALIWRSWRAAPDRMAYVWYFVRIVAVMLAVSSWYVIPYGWALLHGGQLVADTYEPMVLGQKFLPFLEMTPLGLAQAIGLAGLLWLRRSVWWAPPILTLIAGIYAYYLINFGRYVITGHTGLLHYSLQIIGACLLSSAVLTIDHIRPDLARRAGGPLAYRNGVVVGAIALMFAGYTYWEGNLPGSRFGAGAADASTAPSAPDPYRTSAQAARAHGEPFPDGGGPRFDAAVPVADRPRWFPVGPVRRAVEDRLGKGARPRTLACDERLFAFLPWRGYITVDRGAAATPMRWDDRYAELIRLSNITTPADFAAAAEHTKFGPIDVFVLRRAKSDLVWRYGPSRPLRFDRRQFQPTFFELIENLPENVVVAIRREIPNDGSLVVAFPPERISICARYRPVGHCCPWPQPVSPSVWRARRHHGFSGRTFPSWWFGCRSSPPSAYS